MVLVNLRPGTALNTGSEAGGRCCRSGREDRYTAPLPGVVDATAQVAGRGGPGTVATSLWVLEEAGVRRRSDEVALKGHLGGKNPMDGTWGGGHPGALGKP